MKNYFSIILVFTLIVSGQPEATANIGSSLSQASRFYKKIQADEDQLQNKRLKSQSAFRPKSCPVFSSQYSSLAAKMKRVVNMLENDSECMAKIGGTVKNIEADITKMNKFQQDQEKANTELAILRTSARGGVGADPLTTQQQSQKDLQARTRAQQISVVQSSLGNFTSLAQNVACKSTLTASDGVGMLSDVIVGTTSYGMMDQGATGVGSAIALGGMAVGSILKMISLLLIDNWDFYNEEDRNNFVKLNCSFFQLKTDMDEVGILEVKTTAHDAEIRRLNALVKSIDDHVRKLTLAINKDTKLNKMRNMAKVISKLSEGKKYDGKKNAQLHYKFKDIQSLLNGEAQRARRDDEQAGVLVKIFDQYKEMIALVNDPGINMGTTGRSLHYPKIQKEYASNNLIGNAKTGQDLWKRILKAPDVKVGATSPSAYDYFISKFLSPVMWLMALQEQKINKGRMAQVLKSPLIKARIAIDKLNALAKQYEERANFLSKVKKGGIFSDEDDGTNIKTNILIGFKKIEESIYGKLGGKFLDYVTSNGSTSMKQFIDLLKSSRDHFKGSNNSKCADALRTRQAYNLGESLTNQAYDFLATNMDSFYEPNKRHKYLVWKPAFFQKGILKHVTSVKDARDLIKRRGGKFPTDFKIPKGKSGNKIKKLTYTSTGELMLRMKMAQSDIDLVQRYISKARCTSKKGDTGKLNF